MTLRVALRCKGPERLMLVTDAMPSVGMADKHFMLQGQPVHVVDGVCVGADGTLAGSDLDMAQAVWNAAKMMGVPLETAIGMASTSPANFLGLGARTGTIAPGLSADMLLLNDKGDVIQSWVGGETPA